MPNAIAIRQLKTMKEMYQIQEVEKAVWQMEPIPVHQTYTALNNGGILLGAFTNEKMIGYLYSFAGFKKGQTYLCSHMHGILSEYRKYGLGVKMKLKQAELAGKAGYEMITWTFDPLESLNAYLNIKKLGAVGESYQANHYGDMTDGLNQGLPTDRIQVNWHIYKKKMPIDNSLHKNKILLGMNKDSSPLPMKIQSKNWEEEEGPWLVGIPENFQTLKLKNYELAKKWRFETRKVFEKLFANGYCAYDFVRDRSKQISYYIFEK